MSWQYNESLVEGLAVLAYRASAAITPGPVTTNIVGPFHAGNLRRVVFDVLQSTADTSTSVMNVCLLSGTTSGQNPFYTIVGPDTTWPSLITSTITGAPVTATGQYGTTTAAFYRFEYKIESIRAAIDYYNKTTTSTTALAGSWIQLGFNYTAYTGTGTFTCSAVAYGVMGYAPSADVQVNRFLGWTATSGALITTVACKNSAQFIDGWRLTIPAPTSPLASILPY